MVSYDIQRVTFADTTAGSCCSTHAASVYTQAFCHPPEEYPQMCAAMAKLSAARDPTNTVNCKLLRKWHPWWASAEEIEIMIYAGLQTLQ
jgi:hypothetical protein